MKGLIYKDISLFFKSIDKKVILIAAGTIILLMFNTGVYEIGRASGRERV